jgi:hypothetical protein
MGDVGHWDFGGGLIRTDNGRYDRGPRNVERNQGVPRFGKGKSAALDRWADSISNSGVAQDLVQMGAVHKERTAA